MGKGNAGTVLITGGASGIGLATARLLGERGYDLHLIDLKQEALEAAAGELGLSREQVSACDVRNEDAIERAVTQAARQGHLTAVVNSAGIAIDRPAVETSVEDFRRIVDINLTGSFIAARAAARHWLANGEAGSIVNISSVSGMCGNKGRSAYGASKGGLNILTMVMATELGAHGIRVNVVAPGPVDTPLAREMHTEDVRGQWNARVPQGRYGTPAEIAGAVAFLIGADGAYVNGQVLAVDGGFINAGLAV